MERNYMKSNALVELDFITERMIPFHSHENFELLYVISGAMSIQIEEDIYTLRSGDMILVNVNRKHMYQGNNSLLLGRFCISDIKVRELLGMDHVLFWCNSTIDQNGAYRELRSIILKIFNQMIGSNQKNKLYMTSMYYQMLHILTENFLLNPEQRYDEETRQTEADDRIQDIFAYIRANYRQNISLQDLADQLFLSTTYVSRYIKQKCGINFIELLNQVRLTHAMEDLIYTDDSIMKIALENGFASVAAYNKTFKDAHHMTPSEFRKKRRKEKDQNKEAEQKRKRLIAERVEEYLGKNPDEIHEETEALELNLTADLQHQLNTKWDGYCCKLINIGGINMLLDGGLQKQLLDLNERLGFTYVRFWDIYSPDMYLDIHARPGEQNYSRLNGVLDFLVLHKLKPYMELGFKPIRILRNAKEAVREEPTRQRFATETEMENFYRDMIHYFVTRYGAEEVSSWYFEYWEENNIHFDAGNQYFYSGMAAESHKSYFREFSLIAKCFKERLPEVKIGGGGFPVRFYGENGFAQILTVWKQELYLPDFISISCYPYNLEEENGTYYEKRSTDRDFVKHHIEMAKSALKLAHFPEVELHVSEYNMTLSNRNIINDSCLKGAFLIYNAIRCMGQADIMGHWFFTDIYSEAWDTRAPLFGGSGLLTKIGSLKPACFAMDFMNRLYRNVLALDNHYIVTGNSRGSVKIVCHNLKKLNFQYYMEDEDQISVKNLPIMMENRNYLTLHIRLEHMKEGSYRVRKNQINNMYGNVLAKWQDLNLEPNISMYEIAYLRESSIPSNKVQIVEAKNGVVEFDTVLEPNEMQYLYVSSI